MIYRNNKLLAAIRQLPCASCGIEGGSQAAHSNLLRHGKGRGLKASDAATFPLCVPCHMEFDQGKALTKAEREQLTMDWLAWTHIQLIENEMIEVKR
ncbi:hypothetical protein O5O45_05625 [Hahella aquimaris]|uniref:hypothetical protein n=1 Tax=Hahella sp. HNIBRBA332 TaxID=3015983 RepID=UPI00273A7B69|nr:hypothetical protein [Hahella sp. HNIBRBA332]WLQ15399.1 hypothetical protein O5O45_05625 [Hahella sp. HNIBRBA332]